jgi:hypothetical protein
MTNKVAILVRHFQARSLPQSSSPIASLFIPKSVSIKKVSPSHALKNDKTGDPFHGNLDRFFLMTIAAGGHDFADSRGSAK